MRLRVKYRGGGARDGARGNRGAGGVRTGPGRAPRVWERPGPSDCLGLLRPGCRWVWEAGSGLCGGYIRWIEPLGVLGDMSVGSGPGWSGVGWVKWKGRGSGMGGWEIGEGVGWEERGFKPNGTATEHREGVARLA
jgi:hypothetical protein